MKNIIILLILLVTSFSNCITNQQDSCKRKIAIDEADMESCVKGLAFTGYVNNVADDLAKTKNSTVDTSSSKNEWLNLMLARCLVAIENERNCDKKSKYIPTIGESN